MDPNKKNPNEKKGKQLQHQQEKEEPFFTGKDGGNFLNPPKKKEPFIKPIDAKGGFFKAAPDYKQSSKKEQGEKKETEEELLNDTSEKQTKEFASKEDGQDDPNKPPQNDNDVLYIVSQPDKGGLNLVLDPANPKDARFLPNGTRLVIKGTKNQWLEVDVYLEDSCINGYLSIQESQAYLLTEITLSPVVVTPTNERLDRIKELFEEEKAILNNFPESYVSYLLKEMSPSEQNAFLAEDHLMSQLKQYLDKYEMTTALSHWEMPLQQKLLHIEQARGSTRMELGYEDIRPLILNSSKEGFTPSRWQDLFEDICVNKDMPRAVEELGLDPETATKWKKAESFFPNQKPTDYVYDDLTKDRKINTELYMNSNIAEEFTDESFKKAYTDLTKLEDIEQFEFKDVAWNAIAPGLSHAQQLIEHLQANEQLKQSVQASNWAQEQEAGSATNDHFREHVNQQRSKFLADFQVKALKTAHALLDQNEQQIKQNDVFTPEMLTELQNALQKYDDTFKEIQAERHRNIVHHPRGIHIPPDSQIPKIKTAKQQIRTALSQDFPIIANGDIDPESIYKQFQNGNAKDIRKQFESKAAETHANIDYVRKMLRSEPEKIWELKELVDLTKGELLNLENGSVMEDMVNRKVADVKADKLWRNIGLAALGIGLGIAGFFTGGGTWGGAALALGGIGVSTVDAYVTYQDYKDEKAVGGTAYAQAQALTNDDPSIAWVALSVASIGLDFASMVKVVKAMKGVDAIGEAADYSKNVGKAAAEVAENIKIPPGKSKEEVIQQLIKDSKRAEAERLARKAKVEEDYQSALDDLLKHSRSRLYSTPIDPELFAKLTKVAFYAVKKGIVEFDDFVKSLKPKLSNKIDFTDPKQREEVERAFEAGKRQLDDMAEQTEASYTNLSDLLDELMDGNNQNVGRLQEVWEQYMRHNNEIEIPFSKGNKKVSFKANEQGNMEMMVDGKKASKTERKETIEKLGLAHAERRHSPNKDPLTVANETISRPPKPDKPVTGKFNSDYHFIQASNLAKKKFLDDNGQIPANLVGQAIDFPVPSNFGRAFINTDLRRIPAEGRVINEQPFPNSNLSNSIVEVEVTKVRVIFDQNSKITSIFPIPFN